MCLSALRASKVSSSLAWRSHSSLAVRCARCPRARGSWASSVAASSASLLVKTVWRKCYESLACSERITCRGRGVPGARLEALFRPFERLGPEDGVAGTGLGLAIVREIAEGHGGSAAAHRPEGPGLAFEIRIPARPGEDKS